MANSNQVPPFPSSLVPELRKRCENAWRNGEYETVILNALKVLEGHIADAIGETELIGVKLIDKAMAPTTGKLRLRDHPAEQEGLHQTLRGLFLLFRNPSAHRFIEYIPQEAEAIIRFVNLLLESLNRALASQDHEPDFRQGFSHYILADADGDGAPEKIVVVRKEPYPSLKSEVNILKRTSTGLQKFRLLEDFLEFGAFHVEVRDINQDKVPEVIVSNPVGAHAESMHVFRWDGVAYREIGDFWSDAPCIEIVDLDSDAVCEVRTFCRNYGKDPLKDSFVKVFHWDGRQYVLGEEYATTER